MNDEQQYDYAFSVPMGEPSATPGEERIDVDYRTAAYAEAGQINPDPEEWSLATSEQIAAVKKEHTEA